MKPGGPLLGYNNNIPYKGHVYHVQTEDSGSKRPHVITHLFADGGRIIKTRKTSYAQMVDGREDLADRVRSLMREQHKGMVISLRDGDFDHLIDPDPASPPDPKEVVEELEAAPPSAPIELLERAAAVDESEFHQEIERVSKDEAPQRRSSPGSPAGGTYSFVGDREPEDAPKTKGAPPRRRMRATGQSPPADGAPPAVDVAAPRPKRPLPPRRAKGVRTGAIQSFGRRHGSPKRLDELMAAYLQKQG